MSIFDNSIFGKKKNKKKNFVSEIFKKSNHIVDKYLVH